MQTRRYENSVSSLPATALQLSLIIMDRPRTNGADPPWVAFFGWDEWMEPVGWTDAVSNY